jgi:hypothetical protein
MFNMLLIQRGSFFTPNAFTMSVATAHDLVSNFPCYQVTPIKGKLISFPKKAIPHIKTPELDII